MGGDMGIGSDDQSTPLSFTPPNLQTHTNTLLFVAHSHVLPSSLPINTWVRSFRISDHRPIAASIILTKLGQEQASVAVAIAGAGGGAGTGTRGEGLLADATNDSQAATTTTETETASTPTPATTPLHPVADNFFEKLE